MKEQRHENILLSLKKLGFASRSQLQKLHRLGGERNANRILNEMSDYLCSVRLEEKVYYLSKEGRERVGCDRILKKTNQIPHYLMRNALYIGFGCPATWRNEVKLSVKNEASIIADALFVRDGRYCICEIDNTQKMSVNREKIRKYRRLLELNVFEKPPAFIWATTTDYRKKELLKLCGGMSVHVYLASDFK